MAKATKKKVKPKKEKPLKVNMTFEELLKMAISTPPTKKKE